jgi:hypothetical protein
MRNSAVIPIGIALRWRKIISIIYNKYNKYNIINDTISIIKYVLYSRAVHHFHEDTMRQYHLCFAVQIRVINYYNIHKKNAPINHKTINYFEEQYWQQSVLIRLQCASWDLNSFRISYIIWKNLTLNEGCSSALLHILY